MTRRLTPPEVARLRRSLAMAEGLPEAEWRWLLDEAERLVRLEHGVAVAISELRAPVADLRGVLNRLATLTGEDR